MIGKVDPERLASTILGRTGVSDDAVVQGPAYGEDTGAIDLGEQTLVINADPLSLAASDVGTLAMQVVCNDVAASGARPRWVTNTMFLPEDNAEMLDTITTQLDRTARSLGVAIVSGHTEYAPDLSRPLLSLTGMGLTERYVSTGGGRPGDVVVIVGAAGLEGTAILAADFRDELLDAGVDPSLIDEAAGYLEDISVLPAAMALRNLATGMHDPTEGGVLAGLVELATATEAHISISRDRIPLRPATPAICQSLDIDPLRTFGSGALLATIPADQVAAAKQQLSTEQLEASIIGEIRHGEGILEVDGDRIPTAPTDEIYELWQ